MASSTSAPPSARAWPFVASTGELVYMWGGREDRVPETIFIFHHETRAWTRELTQGVHPPAGLHNGGSTVSGQSLYLYGGAVRLSCHSNLYELDTKNWTWRKVSDGGAAGPGKKTGCRMISYQDRLLVVGGDHGKTPTSRQTGASYEDGKTNEIHSYNLTTGKK